MEEGGGGTSCYFYPAMWSNPTSNPTSRFEGVSKSRDQLRGRVWRAKLSKCAKGGRPQFLGCFATEDEAARAYAVAYEAAFGTERREDGTADLTSCRSVWLYLVELMGEDVDQLGLDLSFPSLLPLLIGYP